MPQKLPPRNPSQTHRRKVVAARRVGVNTYCTSCGERRSEALIRGSNPIICAACQRSATEHRGVDKHHFAGKANNPATIPVPVNDHRAHLSVAQSDWPTATLEILKSGHFQLPSVFFLLPPP